MILQKQRAVEKKYIIGPVVSQRPGQFLTVAANGNGDNLSIEVISQFPSPV
jgi:hypothetical protein